MDVLYAPDWKWLNHWSQPGADQRRRQAWEKHPIRYCGMADTAEEFDGWMHLPGENYAGKGFCFELDTNGRAPTEIYTGGNAGFTMINLAVLMGAKRVLLLGYDMRKVNGARHWFGHHPKNTTLDVDSPYEGFLLHYPFTVPQLAARGIEVINCTPDSALTVYPMMPLTEAL